MIPEYYSNKTRIFVFNSGVIRDLFGQDSSIMLWNTIKAILQKQKGTCIIVEDGKPVYVVTTFADYENLTREQVSFEKGAPNISEQELIGRINQEITNWKVAQAEQQAEEALEPPPSQEVKIEDLPL